MTEYNMLWIILFNNASSNLIQASKLKSDASTFVQKTKKNFFDFKSQIFKTVLSVQQIEKLKNHFFQYKASLEFKTHHSHVTPNKCKILTTLKDV